jgi:hypothetical protein
MSTIIRIKRTTTAGDPSVLGDGVLAYSAADYGNVAGGGRLFIGVGAETAGDAASHLVIGGQYFTDKLDHAPGTLTASSAIITNTDNKIDILNVDNITLNGNTISTTNANGNLSFTPSGKSIFSTNVELTSDLLVTGNLTVNGTTTTINTTELVVADPILYIAEGNNVTNSVDIGFMGGYNSGTYAHTGLLRNHADNEWYLFNNYSSEPTDNTINFTGINLASLNANVIGGLTGNASTATTLETARTISLSGDVQGSVSFNGSSNVSINANINTASTSVLGVASFNANNFDVTAGAVSITVVDGGTY